MENSRQKKDIFLLVILILLLIVLVSGATYAYLNTGVVKNSSTGQGGCFNVDYEGQDISSDNLQSTTNYLEGAKTVVTLSKAADCEIYTSANIYIETDEALTSAPIEDPQALKYKVVKGDYSSGSEPSANSLVSEGKINSKNNSILLASDLELTTTDTDYTIYIWIDSDESNGEYNGTTYSGYIYAESVQSSTIKK